MRAFALVLIPLVAAAPNADADVAFTAFTHFGGVSHGAAHHAVHHAPVVAHHAVHHAPAYHAPAHYAYEAPKHNCGVVDVVETVETCTPAFETVCADVELPIKKIVDSELCYTVTATVCSESIQVVENEICTYSYQQKSEDTTAKTVAVTFEKICDVQMVTVCQPTPGYGYHSYGHNYCKEVAQETCYNSPVVAVDEPAVTVAYPEPVKTCVQKPIDLPIISCEDIKSRQVHRGARGRGRRGDCGEVHHPAGRP